MGPGCKPTPARVAVVVAGGEVDARDVLRRQGSRGGARSTRTRTGNVSTAAPLPNGRRSAASSDGERRRATATAELHGHGELERERGREDVQDARQLTLVAWEPAAWTEENGGGRARARSPAAGAEEDDDGAVDPELPGSIPSAWR